eukprot:366625_1
MFNFINHNKSNNSIRITELEMQIKILKESLDDAIDMLQTAQQTVAWYESQSFQTEIERLKNDLSDTKNDLQDAKNDLKGAKTARDEALQTVKNVASCFGDNAEEADELSNKINNVLIEAKNGVERRKMIQKILDIETADKQRKKNLNDNKNWLTLLTIIIS